MQFIKCEKSDLKYYILNDSIRMTFWKRQKCRDRRQTWFPGVWEGSGQLQGNTQEIH